MTKFAFLLACALSLFGLNEVAAEAHPEAAVAHAEAAHEEEHGHGHCSIAIIGAVRGTINAGQMLAGAVKQCPHSAAHCTVFALEATSFLLKSAGSILNSVTCFTKGHPVCPGVSMGISGAITGLGVKIYELAHGVCAPHDHEDHAVVDEHHRRLTSMLVNRSLKEEESKDDQIAKGVTCGLAVVKTILPLTQIGLTLGFEIEKCKEPHHELECTAIALEVAAAAAGAVGAVVGPTGIVNNCGPEDTINAECAGAISGLVEESTEVAAMGIQIKNTCGGEASEPHLRLYQEVPEAVAGAQPPAQQFPWAVTGLSLLMVPLAFVAGRRNRLVQYDTLSVSPDDAELLASGRAVSRTPRN